MKIILNWLLTPKLIPTRPLTGRRLTFTRFLSSFFLVVSVLLFMVALPVRYTWLSDLAENSVPVFINSAGGLSPFGNTLLQNFPSLAIFIETAVMSLYVLCSVLLLWRRSWDWMALLTVAALATFAVHIIPTLITLMKVDARFMILGNVLKTFGIGLTLVFLYLFPGGFYSPSWMRLFLFLWILWAFIWVFFPSSIFSFLDPYNLSVPGFLLLSAWWSTGIYSQIYRFIRVSKPLEKQQTKFITYSATFALAGYAAYIPLRELMGFTAEPVRSSLVFHMVAPYVYLILIGVVPVTIVFSILRYRLWDIDVIIRRTLVYTVLTATLALIYFGTVFLLQTFMFDWLHRLPNILFVLTTLGVAALINPLRQRIQRDIDRRFYRHNYDAEKTLQSFAESSQHVADLEELASMVHKAVDDTMQPTIFGLWLRKESPHTHTQESFNHND